MSRSCRTAAWGFAAFGLMLLVAPTTFAQSSCGTLAAPPSAIVPPGDTLRAGHLGREVGDLPDIVHFYSDLIGLGMVGPRTAPLRFMVSHPLAEFAELGEDANAYDSVSRVSLLPIPGTAAAPGGPLMTIEAIEIKGIHSRPYRPAMSDPGASYLKLIVRDLDATLAVLKSERTPVITVGGNPVELAAWPGMSGQIRAVFVRDPDGYPVELMQLTPTPQSTAPAGSKVLGARVAVVVDNLEATCRMYRRLVGPGLQFWVSPTLLGDESYEKLTNNAGRFRLAEAMVPGSPVALELIEYANHDRHFKRAYIQDPDTAHFLFMTKDDDVIIQRVRAAHLHTLSRSNAPVYLSSTVRSMFVPDPQGFWLEFMDRVATGAPQAGAPAR